MPKTTKGLSENLKKELPKKAQKIYVEALNNAEEEYSDPKKRGGKQSKEQVAHKVAWSAVKHQYEKDEEGKWHRK